MATIIVSNSTALSAALNSAKSGDTIKLASGDYSSLTISNVHFTGVGVTITSANASAQAQLNGLMIKSSEGLTFSNITFVANADKANPYQILDSSRIKLDHLDVHGSMNAKPEDDSTGLLIRRSDGVTVTNSEFHELKIGVAHVDSKNVTIDHNKFHDISTDGVRGGGTSNITVSNNFFTDFRAADGAHPDAIQFWTTHTTASAHNITVTGNVITRGNGDPTQGVFITDQVGNLHYQHVIISDNLVVGALGNGIRINGADDVVIKNNVVQGLAGLLSKVSISDATRVTLSGNTATGYAIETNAKNVTETNDKSTTAAGDGGKAATLAYLAAHPTVAGLLPGLATLAADKAMLAIATVRAETVTLTGTSGADKLIADKESDTRIDAGAGDDVLTGGINHNTLIGGAGDDIYNVRSAGDTIVENANGGHDSVQASVDYTLAANVEGLKLVGDAHRGVGNDLANGISGNDGNNTLSGLGGDDVLSGNAGADSLDAGAGGDVLYGGEGADTLAGGDGADRLRGDEGNDSLVGGGGNDTMDGSTGADTLSGGAGADQFKFGGDASKDDMILDFSHADGDTVQLSGLDANAKLAGDQRFAFIGTSAFHKVAGELRFEVVNKVSHVYADANGDGVADFHLVMPGAGTLVAADFIL